MKKDILEKGAVVQRDRESYAITPHLPAGLVTPDQLRRIAAAAEKFKVHTIKLTSAQRIALIGLAEEDLDAVWQDLDTPQGRPVGLCIRSVKVCPGTDCCKRGLQDSINVGLELDRRFHGRQLPWKMKLAVSGCPNDCAEVCLRDIGLIGSPKGWHLMVGGNGGSQPRLSRRLLEHLPDKDQALAAVEHLLDWFAAQDRKCRMGKLVDEAGLETLRQVALGAGRGGDPLAGGNIP
ncbi:MAG TPA: NAD(P)/FAD-dependent oxidoreductase [Geopsychrobacteraceae bacterium]|nr:NAD(P)/FAD-dependent oxidoreductase [Geopsychrobacteraceae bacterium]